MQHSNDDHYPESSPKPSPRGLRHEKEAFLPPDRRVDMLPPTRDDAPCRIRYSDGSPTSIDVGSFERPTNSKSVLCPSGDRYGTRIGRLGGVPFDGTAPTDPATTCCDDLLVCLRLNGVFTAIYNDVDARVSGNAQGLFPKARERNWRSSPNRAVALNPPANQSVSGRNDDDRLLLENIILQSPGEIL
jgi:hypothetical protein